MKFKIYLFLIPLFIFTACSVKQEENIPNKIALEEEKPKVIIPPSDNFSEVSFNELNGFFEDDLDFALEVFKKDCEKSKRFELFKNVCEKAEYEKDGKNFFISHFQPYKLYDKDLNDKGTITGYYEPLLHGSLKKTAKYKYPVYSVPKDLIVSDHENLKDYKSRGKIVKGKVVPYDKRKDIEANPNNPNYKAIAYVDDKYDLFFLQIQGSGKIKLEDGRILNLGFAGVNGWPYTGISTYMLEKGYLNRSQLSIQEMKKFFINNPSKIDEVLNKNDSYVFFQFSQESAKGSLGSVLTERRNLAVDRDFIPLGMPIFLNTKNPISKDPINQLMVAADVGGAIKGEIRADFFWGFGPSAFEYAGRMKEKGEMYILMPKY